MKKSQVKGHPQHSAPISKRWANVVKFVSITGLTGSVDSVSGKLPAINGSVSRRPTLKGLASYTSSGTNGLVWSSIKPVTNTSEGLSLLVIANPLESTSMSRVVFIGDEVGPPIYNQCNLVFNGTMSGADQIGIFSVFEYNNGFQAKAQSDWGTLGTGGWHVYIANRQPGTATWTLYRDGRNVTLAADTAAGIALTDGVRIHCAPLSTNGYTGDVVLAAVLSSLNKRQIAELSSNPWALFQVSGRRSRVSAAGGTTQELTPPVATSASVASTPILIPGAVNLPPTGAVSTSVATAPTLTPGAAVLSPTAAESESVVATPVLTAGSDLQTPAAVSTTAASTPTLSSGPVALSPSAAVSSSIASTPILQNGSSLITMPAGSTSVASTPLLGAGSVNLVADTPASLGEVPLPDLAAGSVNLTPSAAVSMSVAAIPLLSSGSALNSVRAISVSVAATPVLVAGNTDLIPTVGVSDSVASVPVFTSQANLIVLPAVSVSVAAAALLFNSGAGRSAVRRYTIAAENRSYSIPGESRNYTLPV